MILLKPNKPWGSTAERFFVQALLLVLFCFAATQVSILVPARVADYGRWLSMTAALYLGFTWQYKSGRKLFSKSLTVNYLIFIMLFLFFLSSIESVAKDKSFLYLATCTLQVILFTFLTRGLRLESWRIVFDMIALLCVFVSIMGLTGYATDPEKYIVQGRLAGLGNANSMGLIAMIGFITSLAKYLFADLQSVLRVKRFKWRLKHIYLFGTIGCLIVLWLTGSRSALGGMIAGIVVVLFFTGKFKKMMPGLLILGLFMPIVNFSVDNVLQQSITTHIVREKGSNVLNSRRHQWAEAIYYFQENPWLGKGYAVHDRAGMVIDGSGYHGLLASVGAVGIIAFISVALWVLWFLLRRGVFLNKRKRYYPCNRELMAYGGGGFVALLVQGVGEPWMLGPGSFMHVVYWLSIGACIAGIIKPQMAVLSRRLIVKYS